MEWQDIYFTLYLKLHTLPQCLHIVQKSDTNKRYRFTGKKFKNLHLSLISNSNGLIMILMLILESKDSMSQSLELLRVPKIVKMSLSLRPIRETIGGY